MCTQKIYCIQFTGTSILVLGKQNEHNREACMQRTTKDESIPQGYVRDVPAKGKRLLVRV